MNLQDYFAYSGQCRTLLYEALTACGEDVLHRPYTTTGTYDTIAKLIAHCHGAEERWITLHLLEKPLPVSYEDRAAPTLAGLVADGETLRAQTLEYLAAQTPETLASSRTFTIREVERTLSVAEILFHIAHHEAWHRGQISLLLQQFGFDPPNFDYALVRGV